MPATTSANTDLAMPPAEPTLPGAVDSSTSTAAGIAATAIQALKPPTPPPQPAVEPIAPVSSDATAAPKTLSDIVSDAKNPHSIYEKVKLLGSGSYGEAWLVRRRRDNMPLVLKVMDRSQMSTRDQHYADAEIHCLASCNHFTVVKYEDHHVVDPIVTVAMEHCDAGDLNMQIKSRAAELRYFEEHEIAYVFAQLCMALHHVHSNKMLHRDIKGANVLLMSSGLVKLGDFGFSQQYEDTVSGAVAGTFCGTPYYLAPELWKRQKYSKKADIWSLGILLYEMMSLKRPFTGNGAQQKKGLNRMESLRKTVLEGEVQPLPIRYSSGLRQLCLSMLCPDPEGRPSASQMLQTAYLRKVVRHFGKSCLASKAIADDLKDTVATQLRELATASLTPPKGGSPSGEMTDTDAAEAEEHTGPNRAVSHEGLIRKESSGQWKERYLTLADGKLSIAVAKGDNRTRSIDVAVLRDVVPVPIKVAKAEGVLALHTNEGATMWLQAPSRRECLAWIEKLHRAMRIA